MKNHFPVIIIGGGQAGLSMSHCLKTRGIDHLVFEKKRIAESWRSQRWDTFCLVTPNWQCKLPGFEYQGKDLYGFMVKDEIVDFLEEYARSFQPPIREGVEVREITKDERTGMFEVQTNRGAYTCQQVVVATGNFHFPALPNMAFSFPPDVLQIHSADYKNPESIRSGDILVVGTGQSGCQIAEDLHLAGRQVHLCVGNAPRTARRYRGKDVVEWLDQMGYYDMGIDEHPDKENVRDKTNHYVTGRDGGRDIDLRQFALQGMKLYGSLKDINGTTLEFKEDLGKNLDNADQSSENIKKKIDEFISAHHIEAPEEAPYTPAWKPSEEISALDYRKENIRSVIWCIGFGYDFTWIKLPVLDERGLPVHARGVTQTDGLYFLGLTWQYTWGSARFSGVGRDADYLAEKISLGFHTPVHTETAALEKL